MSYNNRNAWLIGFWLAFKRHPGLSWMIEICIPLLPADVTIALVSPSVYCASLTVSLLNFLISNHRAKLCFTIAPNR
ncbi:hypothetical protein BDV23DRAFT_159299 [Aspergillus alliaceus]|uniref:Uncharacterized protein n=1 Tax=Petromyces alliaceus TaxID=209559 RepID=A0A5N7C2S1_PETAA|nr:hypothetical protein BDV23DRAFT_159299 [Aspergillus alliaceus]